MRTISIIKLKRLPILFLVVFLVYNLNFRETSSGDTIPTRFLPISILHEFNLDLDEFPGLYNTPTNRDYLYIQNVKGHWFSSYPIVSAILAVPIYAPFVMAGIELDGRGIDILSKLSSSAIIALSVIFIFITLKLLIQENTALQIALLYAFATSNWSVSSQGLWQHGTVELLLSIAVYFLVRGKKEKKFIFWASPFLALAVAARTSVVLIAGIIFLYVLINHRKEAIKFAIPAIIIAILLFSYNLYYFGELTGGNVRLEKRMFELKGGTTWTANFLPGLAGLLISPSRGLLTHSPFLIFSFAGIYYVFKQKKELYKYIALSSILYIIFFSFYTGWHGGFTYGYRYLLDILPLLCLFLAFSIEKVLTSSRLKLIFVFLVLFSLFVQFVGFLNYPSDWNTFPASIEARPERLWDIMDNQIIRCVKNGSRFPLFLKSYYDNFPY